MHHHDNTQEEWRRAPIAKRNTEGTRTYLYYENANGGNTCMVTDLFFRKQKTQIDSSQHSFCLRIQNTITPFSSKKGSMLLPHHKIVAIPLKTTKTAIVSDI